MKLIFAVPNNNHQTLIRLLRNHLLPKGEGIFFFVFHPDRAPLKNARQEPRGPRDFLLLEGEGVMRSMTDEVLEVAVGSSMLQF